MPWSFLNALIWLDFKTASNEGGAAAAGSTGTDAAGGAAGGGSSAKMTGGVHKTRTTPSKMILSFIPMGLLLPTGNQPLDVLHMSNIHQN